jgi:anti-anti-sigma regulatory factor
MFARNPKYPLRAAQAKLAPRGNCFSHTEAYRLFLQAMSERARQIVIDLEQIEEATTSAFAQLVVLRRTLLRTGRDLCVSGLRDRAEGLFEVNRLGGVLPRI